MTKKLPVAINDEEFSKLIKNTKKPHHKLSFLLGYGSGLRISEIIGLKKKIHKTDKGYIEVKKIKEGDKEKTIYLCGKCDNNIDLKDIRFSILKNDWDNPPLQKNNVFINERYIRVIGKGDKERVVPLPKGFKSKHLILLPIGVTPRALQKSFKRASEKAGLLKVKPTLHFHSLRHGFATNSLNKGIPLHHVRTMLGHSNISTTNIYLEANPKDALRSYEELF